MRNNVHVGLFVYLYMISSEHRRATFTCLTRYLVVDKDSWESFSHIIRRGAEREEERRVGGREEGVEELRICTGSRKAERRPGQAGEGRDEDRGSRSSSSGSDDGSLDIGLGKGGRDDEETRGGMVMERQPFCIAPNMEA